MKRIVGLLFIASCFAATSSYAQQAQRRGGGGGGQQPTSREDALDPTPVDPKADPNVDMWINDYRNAKPRTAYGSLLFRDILTRLDGADKAVFLRFTATHPLEGDAPGDGIIRSG